MINEEGGVDPEQFRMEAMFDRVDAIGKGVLGLTVQCAQCHSHKFDPISHEEYYRLFAFLNNDDEPARVVYTPDEQSRWSPTSAGRSARSRTAIRHSNPDWRERMDRWEDERAQGPPAEVDRRPGPVRGHLHRRPEVPAPARRLVPGGRLRPDQAHRQVHGEGRPAEDHRLPARADERRQPARLRAGPVALGDLRPDRVQRRGRLEGPQDGQDRQGLGRLRAGRGPARSLLRRPIGQEAGRRPGRLTRSTASGETAWGIDAGPGRRNVGHEAVFVAEKPVEASDGKVELTFSLAQNHGGWNSDDLMTNNLGRFRLSVTDDPDAAADPVPRPGPRGPGRPPRPPVARAGRDDLRLLADHRPRVEGRERPDRGPLEGPPRRGDHPGPPGPGRAADDRDPQARRLPQARQDGRARASPRSSTRSRPTPRRTA